MDHDRLITGIAVALAGCAGVLTLLAFVYNLAILAVAAGLGAAAYFMWYQASGRLAAKIYRSVEDQARQNGGRERSRNRETGGFGAGPREEWTAPGGGGQGRQRAGQQRQQRHRRRRRAPSASEGPSRAEAYRILGLDDDADESEVKRAYRQKVKEVHPDTDSGDEERFKKVNQAYERLT
ncbi:J domain-containing protein [Halorientalis sp.]|uniref:J domain-containing protein n=1 Tax=Halorientalis sp. TaxID=1931229 RepID=UPI00261E2FBE|nr:J domain-containing protein [Halorientalis sp.]